MKTSRNLFFNILQSISQIIFPIITFPYVSRVLGPEGMGLANFSESFCRYFMLFAALGVPIYGVREISKVSTSFENRSKIFSEVILIHLVATFISLLIYTFVIFNLAKFQENITIYLVGYVYIFFNVFSIEWLFNGMNEFKFVSIRSIIIKFLSLVVLFLVVKTKDDLTYYFCLNVAILVVNNLVNIYYLRSKVKFIYKGLNLKAHLKPLIYIYSSTIAVSVYVLMDTLILGFLKGNTFVGYYTTASKLNKIPLSFVTSLGVVLIPQLTKAFHENDNVRFKELIDKSFDFVVSLSIPIAFGLFICAPQLIQIFSGSEFLPALNSMRALVFITLLIGLSNIFGFQILTPMSKDKYFLLSVSIGTIISLVLNFSLIPLFNDLGAAFANLGSEIIVTLITFHFVRKFYKHSFKFQKIIYQIVCYSPVFLVKMYFDTFRENPVVYTGFMMLVIGLFFIIINIWILKTEIIKETLDKFIFNKLK